MHLTLRTWIAAAVAAALLAPLLGAAGASATTGLHHQLPVKAGPTGTSFMAKVEVTIGGGATAPVTTAAPLANPGLLGLPLNNVLARLQGRLISTIERTKAGAGANVEGLRTRVTSLRRKAIQMARKLKAQAISEARATADSVWMVVNASGAVIAQSGNVVVSHTATGAYSVSSVTGGPISPELGMSVEVHLTGPGGAPMDGGWYLTADAGDAPVATGGKTAADIPAGAVGTDDEDDDG